MNNRIKISTAIFSAAVAGGAFADGKAEFSQWDRNGDNMISMQEWHVGLQEHDAFISLTRSSSGNLEQYPGGNVDGSTDNGISSNPNSDITRDSRGTAGDGSQVAGDNNTGRDTRQSADAIGRNSSLSAGRGANDSAVTASEAQETAREFLEENDIALDDHRGEIDQVTFASRTFNHFDTNNDSVLSRSEFMEFSEKAEDTRLLSSR